MCLIFLHAFFVLLYLLLCMVKICLLHARYYAEIYITCSENFVVITNTFLVRQCYRPNYSGPYFFSVRSVISLQCLCSFLLIDELAGWVRPGFESRTKLMQNKSGTFIRPDRLSIIRTAAETDRSLTPLNVNPFHPHHSHTA